jgi:Tfp pilus assembly protein PilO
MPNLTHARHRLRIVLVLMLAISALAAVALFTPWVGSRRAYQEQYGLLRPQLQTRLQQVAPLDNMEEKVERARRETSRFYEERLPTQASAIAERLGRLASASGVKISQVRYSTEDVEVPGLQRMRIDASLDGDYLQVVKFVNALERDDMFFIVDALSLAEQQAGRVRVEVAVETFLRAATTGAQQG